MIILLQNYLRYIRKFDKKEIRDVFILLNETVKNFPDCTIDLAQSHGDLQPGNILVSNNNSELYLIDWEYTEKRSIFYDSLVLAADCRKPKGLAKRIRTILDGDDLSWNWCIKTDGFRLSKCELAVFLIEDLIVRLSELNIPNLINKDNGLDLWLKEVKKMDWLIHKKALKIKPPSINLYIRLIFKLTILMQNISINDIKYYYVKCI